MGKRGRPVKLVHLSTSGASTNLRKQLVKVGAKSSYGSLLMETESRETLAPPSIFSFSILPPLCQTLISTFALFLFLFFLLLLLMRNNTSSESVPAFLCFSGFYFQVFMDIIFSISVLYFSLEILFFIF